MSLKQQAISGIKWTTISTVIITIAQILKISVLARFLDKADFGLMALVMFVLGFMNLFMDMGLTTAILHKQTISKNEYSSLYWLNFVFSIILYLFILLITKPVSIFYSEKELIYLLPLMGLSLIVSAFGRQFKTIEQKELNFKFISIGDIISALISVIAAIYFAVNNFGIYSLVYAALIQFVINNLYFFIFGLIKKRIRFYFSFMDTKAFLKIGVYQVGGQVLNYFNRDLDILIIGKFLGTELLGGYSLAKQLVYRPYQVANPIMLKVASPLMAKYQNNIKDLKSKYLTLINFISTAYMFILVLFIIFAPTIVYIFYGNDYENIILLARILSIFAYLRALGNPIGSLVIATGRTDLDFYWSLFVTIIFPIPVFIGSLYNIETVAVAITIFTFLLIYPGWHFLVNKMINATFKEYFLAFIPNLGKIILYKNLLNVKINK